MTPLATPYVGVDPRAVTDAVIVEHQDRILFESDFPLIPYDDEEERWWAAERAIPATVREKIFLANAVRFLAAGDSPRAG